MSDQMHGAEKGALTPDERETLAERILAVLHGRDGAAFLRDEAATPWRNALAQVAEAEHFFATRSAPIPPGEATP